jgi:DNA-binding MarR family transcriptional regulator
MPGGQERYTPRGLMTEEPEVNETHALIAAYIRNHPDDSFQTIASRLGVAVSTISRIARANGLSRTNLISINPEIRNEEK